MKNRADAGSGCFASSFRRRFLAILRVLYDLLPVTGIVSIKTPRYDLMYSICELLTAYITVCPLCLINDDYLRSRRLAPCVLTR